MIAKTDFRSVVDCDSCRTTIIILSLEQLPGEFSLPCPHCGRRGMFAANDVKTIRQATSA